MNRTVKAFLRVIDSHSGAPGPQMGMVIRSEKEIKDTVFF